MRSAVRSAVARARHRFVRAVGYAEAVAPGRPLRLAYADPPYPGKARLYRDHLDYAGEVDHAALIGRLAAYDGWALSTSAQALPAVLALCPPGVRVAAWHRGERPTRSRWPLHAWEPVLFHGGRQLLTGQRRVDSLVCGVGPHLFAQDRALILDAMNQAVSRLYAYENQEPGPDEGDEAVA